MKQRLFNLFEFLLLCTCIMAQDIDNANKLNFTPKVCVGDNFDYSYVKATTVDEKTDTIARNFNLTVSEINDTTIVMKLYFMKSTNSKMDVEDSNNPMTGVMKKCMNKLTSQEYKVAIDKKTGKYLGIYGGKVIGHNLAVEIIDSLTSMSRKIDTNISISDNDKGAMRASFAYLMNPENMFEELVSVFWFSYVTSLAEITGKDISKNIKETDEGIIYTEENKAENSSDDRSVKISLGKDNMLCSFNSIEHEQQQIYEEDGSNHIENHTTITKIERIN